MGDFSASARFENVFRSVATLAAGSGFARLIVLAVTPVVTRIYTPEEFGALAVFTALTAILLPLLTFCYPLALPLPSQDRSAANLAVLSLSLALSLSIVLFAVFWVTSGAPLSFLSAPMLIAWWPLVIFGAFGAAVFEILVMWANRRRAFAVMARNELTQAFVAESVKVGLGLLGVGGVGLIAGQASKSYIGITGFIQWLRRDLQPLLGGVRWKYMKLLGQRYSSFPFFRLPSQFMLAFSVQAPLFIGSSLFGPEIAGQLALATLVLGVPFGILSNSMARVYYSEAVGMQSRPENLKSLTIAVQLRMLVLAVPMVAVLFFFAPQLFTYIFGDKWELAGRFAAILSVYMLFQFTSSPLVQIFNIWDRQIVFLAFNSIRAIGILVLAVLALIGNWNATQFVSALSGFLLLLFALISTYILKEINSRAMNARSDQTK